MHFLKFHIVIPFYNYYPIELLHRELHDIPIATITKCIFTNKIDRYETKSKIVHKSNERRQLK